MALAAAWLAGRSGDLVARPQLAAAHLGGRDVDVVVGRRQAHRGGGSRSAGGSARGRRGRHRWAARPRGPHSARARPAPRPRRRARSPRRPPPSRRCRAPAPAPARCAGAGGCDAAACVVPAPASPRSPSPPRPSRSPSPSRPLSVSVSLLGLLGLPLPAQGRNQLLAAHQPVAGDPGRGRAFVQVRQVEVVELARHLGRADYRAGSMPSAAASSSHALRLALHPRRVPAELAADAPRRPGRRPRRSRSCGAASRPSRVRRRSTSATERACSSRAAITASASMSGWPSTIGAASSGRSPASRSTLRAAWP